MGIRTVTRVTCDVCGKKIDGDYLEITVDTFSDPKTYVVHPPRTAALIPCGNDVLEKLKKLFPKWRV